MYNFAVALIEATRCATEQFQLLEFLLKSGAMVDYKTKKHGRTAIDWAKLLNRPMSIRILELASIVQRQSAFLFNAIATGDLDVVKGIVSAGDFFDPLCDSKYYKAMIDQALLQDEAMASLTLTRKRHAGLTAKVEAAMAKHLECAQLLTNAENDLESAFRTEELVGRAISFEFTLFERIALSLVKVDLEEVLPISNPDLPLRIAVFGYGVVFDILDLKSVFIDAKQSPEFYNEFNPSKLPDWYSSVAKLLSTTSAACLRQLQTFTVTRLKIDKAVPIIGWAKHLFVELTEAIESTKLSGSADRHQSTIHTTRSSVSRDARRTASTLQLNSALAALTAGEPLEWKDFNQSPENHNEMATAMEVVHSPVDKSALDSSAMQMVAASNSSGALLQRAQQEQDEEDEILDEEWDSDAEDAWTGYWEKGEWVPIFKKRLNWWDRSTESQMKHKEKLAELSRDDHVRRNKRKSEMAAKFVRLTDEIIKNEVKANESALELSSSSKINANQLAADTLETATGRSSKKSPMKMFTGNNPKFQSNSNSAIKSKNITIEQQQSTQLTTVGHSDASVVNENSKVEGRVDGETSNTNVLRRGYVSPLEGLSRDEIDCFPFVNAMLALLKTIVKYSLESNRLEVAKRDRAHFSMLREDLFIENRDLVAFHEKEFNHRAAVEQQMISEMKKVRYHKRMVHLNREKVRVARLLNLISVNGHTPISWAASLGNYEVVEELLSHGSNCGLVSSLMHLAATYLQKSWIIFKMGMSTRSNKRRKAVLENAEDGSIIEVNDTLSLVRDLVSKKEERLKVLNEYHYQRNRMRFPVPEAIYAGKWEIVQRIFDRRLHHVNFFSTWAFPRCAFPFIALQQGREYEHTKLTIYDVLAHGINDLASGAYVALQGWVPPGDVREPYGETVEYVNSMMSKVQEMIDDVVAGRYRIRLLNQEKINQREGAIEMLAAIQDGNYKKCMELAVKRGISIDMETEEGYTVLTGAAEENVDASNHVFMTNDDGRKCLMVEYLLDRRYYRPGIDLETKSGHTALIRAASLSRAPVVEALLDRGAKIDYVNKFGKTALHYAVLTGNVTCVRMLIERFANQSIRDHDGLTPYELAERENFVNIMSMLSQFGGGYLGPVQMSRGRVTDLISCPLGCGEQMIPRAVSSHLTTCGNRMLPCPKDCGELRVMFKEIQSHLTYDCIRRIVYCEACDEGTEQRQMAEHLEKHCAHRIVTCPLQCGKQKKFLEIPRHTANCTHRPTSCIQQCGQVMPAITHDDHIKNHCENRRVPCPLKCRGLIVFKLLEQHLNENCLMREHGCRFCSLIMPTVDIVAHEQICPERLVPCVLKCDELVASSSMDEHVQFSCKHRYSE